MANWSLPVLGTAYSDFLDDLVALATDAATQFNSAPSNQPDHSIRLLRSPVKFQEWLSAAWNDLVLGVAGGGTGASSASGARTSLGLGTMATQDASAVAITGGTVPASTLTGTITQARLGTGSAGAGLKALFDDQTYKSIPVPVWSYLAKSISYVITSANVIAKTTFLTTAGITYTLPITNSAGMDGFEVRFVDMDGAGMTFTPNAADTILGTTSYLFSFGQYASVTLQVDANGSRWHII